LNSDSLPPATRPGLSSASPTSRADVVIIGGGLAGLTAAVALHRAGRKPIVLEASDRVGGRVRTDKVDGFTLDHGFQVLLTAYPTCQQILNYESLKLRAFEPGAMIHDGQRFRVLGDPWRRPSTAWSTLTHPVGSFADKLRIAKVRAAASRGSLDDVYQRPDVTTIDYLKACGFSSSMIDGFFRPFIGGVFLDESMDVSRRMFDFVFRFFASGDAVVPAGGMAEIPLQLAAQLPAGCIRLQHSVTSLQATTIGLSSGQSIEADSVLIATESDAAVRLLGNGPTDSLQTHWNSTLNLYYSSSCVPQDTRYKYLHLRGSDTGPIQTATVLSATAPTYAPPDRSLISVSLALPNEIASTKQGPTRQPSLDWKDWDEIDRLVKPQVQRWFETSELKLLAVYQIPYGLPARKLDPVIRSPRASDHGGPDRVWIAGDHMATPSIEGAMSSGLKAAEAMLPTLR
jgi:phytoene dehydrogenase-like protein